MTAASTDGGPESAGDVVSLVAGRPRFVRPAGGTTWHGSDTSRGQEHELLLHEGRQVVGRARSADLRLLEATVSLQHVAVTVHLDGRAVLRDLGSENGVRVDGVPVVEVVLTDRNRVELGEVVLVFRTDLGAGSAGRQGGEFG